MGLLVTVYRNPEYDATGGGISAKVNQICLVNVPGPFAPRADAPAAVLESHVPGCLRVRFLECVGRPMMGGNYAATSDSRFGEACRDLLGHDFYGAVAIHDRYEY